MKKNSGSIKMLQKKTYCSPIITLTIIEMEDGIASGSASTTVNSSEITIESENGGEQNGSFEW